MLTVYQNLALRPTGLLYYVHMLLENLFPYLPATLTETLVYVTAGVGTIMLVYSIFLETERRQDLLMLLGAACLLVYALFIGNWVFSIAMTGVGIAALIEFIEIYTGLHRHRPEDLKHYRELR